MDIDKLKKELKEKYSEEYVDIEGNCHTLTYWNKLAHHVVLMILEAQIKALDDLDFMGAWDVDVARRVNEEIDDCIDKLRSELAKVKKEA